MRAESREQRVIATSAIETRAVVLVTFFLFFILNACTLQVKLTNTNKPKDKATTDAIANDKTSPDVSTVVVNDGNYSGSTTQSSAITWNTATDSESGVSKYEIAIGTSLGASDAVAWTDVGSVTSVQLAGVYISGTTYYASLRATDLAGNVSLIVSGDGWLTDAVLPASVSLTEAKKMTFSNSTTPILSWGASSDVHSGLQGYQLAIGTTSGGTEIQNWTSVGNILTTTLNSLTLSGSTKYYSSVRSVDNAGNTSNAGLGSGWYNFSQSKIAVNNSPTTVRAVSTNANFGNAVALSEDGLTMVVGASGDNTDAVGGNYLAQSGAAFVYVKSGGTWQLQQKLVAAGINARQAADRFGVRVGISGDTIVVGAGYHAYDELGINYVIYAGAAYVFSRSSGVWSQQQKLVASGINARMAFDFFGENLAISENSIVVGVRGQAYDEVGGDPFTSAGAAFVFTRSAGVWTQQQKLVASGTNGRQISDYFGLGVSISGDSIVIGAYGQDYDASGGAVSYLNNAGAAYVFTRTAGVWTQQQKLVGVGSNARQAGGNFSNQSVVINADTIAVGSPNQGYDALGNNPLTNAGAVFVFTRTAGVWSQQQKIVGTGTNGRISGDYFGRSVGLSADILVVGAEQQPFDASGGGSQIAAGASFVYTRSAGVWSQQIKLVGSGTNSRFINDYFGTSVAVSGDTIVSGVMGQDYDESGNNFFSAAGAVFAYSVSAGYALTQKIVDTVTLQNRTSLATAGFGKSVAISDDGLTMVVGVPYDPFDENGLNYLQSAGSAYVYVKSGNDWVFQKKLVATGTNARDLNNLFGLSVGVSGDTIVIGAPFHGYDGAGATPVTYAGAVYVYTRTAGVWTQQQKLVATGTNARVTFDYFGFAVGISGDSVVVGAYAQDYNEVGANSVSDAGAVYVFTRTAGVWSQQQKLVGTGVNSRITTDYFGQVVSISGDSIIVGANGQDYNEAGLNSISGAGAAYVFTRTAGVWSQQQKLVGTGTANDRSTVNDKFGASVAINGDTAVVGASGQDYDVDLFSSNVNNAGAAYVFTRTSGVWTLQQKLVATGVNARVALDSLGGSVGISGDTIIVGASSSQYDESGNNAVTNAGAAYVYTRASGVWSQQLKLTPTGTNARLMTDYFGGAVCVHENTGSGTWTIGVSATGQEYDSSGGAPSFDSGAVYMYH